MILPFRPSLLEPAPLIAFGHSVLALEHTPKHEFLHSVAAMIGLSLANLEKALAKVQSSPLTAIPAERDATRDDAFLALREHCKSMARRQPGPLKEAGLALRELISSYGSDLTRIGYGAESGKVTALLKDLASEKFAGHVDTAKAGELVEVLAKAQASFAQAEAARDQEKGRKDDPLLRPSFQQVGADLVFFLDTLAILPRLNPPVPSMRSSRS